MNQFRSHSKVRLNWLSMSMFMILLIAFCSNSATAQEITDAENSKLKRIASLVDRAGAYFKTKDYKDAAKRIRSAQKVLMELAESSGSHVVLKLKTDHQRIVKAKKLLKKQDEDFDSMPSFETLWTKADNRKSNEGSVSKSDSGSGSKPDEGSGSKDSESISFKKHVVPIIIENCGKCHVDESRGKYSAANFVSFKKGTRKGTAVKPRDASKSRIISLIENGAMPPKGDVPEEQLQILKDWIDQGAKFDGSKKEEKSMIKDFVMDDSKQG